MKSAIVISGTRPDLDRLSKVYGDIGSTYLQSPERLVVEGDWGWFAIGIDEALDDEFSDVERHRIGQIVPDPVYAQLEYSNTVAADLAIKLMPTPSEMLIDNDNGMLRPIAEVRDLIAAGMEWQTGSAKRTL